MRKSELEQLCTFAENVGMLQESFIHVVLVHAAFSTAFDTANIQWLMDEGLLPKASIEEINRAMAKAEDLYSAWPMEKDNSK